MVLFSLLFLTIGEVQAQNLRQQAFNVAIEYNLEPDLFIAIIEQESSFKVNAYNKRTRDYGLGQINIKNIERLKLDKRRLLIDSEYNLRESAKVLAYMKRRYGHKEPLWYCRYNVGTRTLTGTLKSKCFRYADLVNKRLKAFSVAKEF